ncbi:hypothetical protein DMA15_16165 [Streptomyces sp. WAC 01529]|uniref:hypothetical protein n=1 Tax=Streptomyces sp. WAC 01529 TaxID=2203205 RepID=UPI000F6FF109|nr:hypothetical protein [Streptomyces sp. WAC 01529]AZM53918.1 hypothetical protein DMA15_16165 [Streptomyces sp. WAC 01529]
MGSVDVVAEAVRVMTGFAGGAAGAVGAEVGQTVSDLVRQRVGGDPAGRAALDVVEARPQDPEALAALREAVRERVAADPEFAARLAEVLAGPPPAGPPPAGPPREYTGSIVIDGGAKVRGSTLSLGPVTFNNTPAGRTALVACLAALVALAVLAVYGGTQAFSGDDSPGGGGGAAASGVEAGDAAVGGAGTGAGGGEWKPQPLADADAVLRVLPDTTSLASGWTMSGQPTADVSSQDDGSTYEGEAAYQGKYGMDTGFRVLAYPSTGKASAAFRAQSRKAAEEGARRMTMPAVGDELVAFSLSEGGGGGYVTETTHYTVVRTGTVITVVSGKDNESRRYDSDDLQSVTQLMSDRARSAQSG